MFFWKTSDFVPCNKPWGKFRRLVATIDVFETPAFIGLFRENDDGRLTISVHDRRNDYCITKLGMYYVVSEQDKQQALDEIYLTLMNIQAGGAS